VSHRLATPSCPPRAVPATSSTVWRRVRRTISIGIFGAATHDRPRGLWSRAELCGVRPRTTSPARGSPAHLGSRFGGPAGGVDDYWPERGTPHIRAEIEDGPDSAPGPSPDDARSVISVQAGVVGFEVHRQVRLDAGMVPRQLFSRCAPAEDAQRGIVQLHPPARCLISQRSDALLHAETSLSADQYVSAINFLLSQKLIVIHALHRFPARPARVPHTPRRQRGPGRRIPGSRTSSPTSRPEPTG
jgi:hypothetical protein